MIPTIHTSHVITPGQRLTFTVFLAVAIHAVIIFQTVFGPRDKDNTRKDLPTLEVTLVNSHSDKEPEQADYLAQTNQEGSGNTNERTRVTSTISAPAEIPIPGNSDTNRPPAIAQQEGGPIDKQLMTVEQADTQIKSASEKAASDAAEPSPAELVKRSMEIAQLKAEIDESMRVYSKLTRQRYITAAAKEARDAAYQESWRAKIERIGELNYPKDAKARHLKGSLILDVAIRADGTIDDIKLVRSSGNKVLDDAAIYIVRLAAPFAPFPAELRKDTDILHITRTWQFLGENSLRTR